MPSIISSPLIEENGMEIGQVADVIMIVQTCEGCAPFRMNCKVKVVEKDGELGLQFVNETKKGTS